MFNSFCSLLLHFSSYRSVLLFFSPPVSSSSPLAISSINCFYPCLSLVLFIFPPVPPSLLPLLLQCLLLFLHFHSSRPAHLFSCFFVSSSSPFAMSSLPFFYTFLSLVYLFLCPSFFSSSPLAIPSFIYFYTFTPLVLCSPFLLFSRLFFLSFLNFFSSLFLYFLVLFMFSPLSPFLPPLQTQFPLLIVSALSLFLISLPFLLFLRFFLLSSRNFLY